MVKLYRLLFYLSQILILIIISIILFIIFYLILTITVVFNFSILLLKYRSKLLNNNNNFNYFQVATVSTSLFICSLLPTQAIRGRGARGDGRRRQQPQRRHARLLHSRPRRDQLPGSPAQARPAPHEQAEAQHKQPLQRHERGQPPQAHREQQDHRALPVREVGDHLQAQVGARHAEQPEQPPGLANESVQ